jgi:uroporphyrin-III C-methyltransferase
MSVALVGAGPGDPGLITVKGLAYVREADVLVYDRLVSPELVAESDGIMIERDRLSQEQVNELLVELGRDSFVVRLKGGDPLLFGRGGEEALALADAEVPFEIVPGVSSLASVPGSVGIPVTHRGLSSAVTAFAAHDVEALDAAALARVPGTLVAFMGGANARRLAQRLIEHGKPASTPAAVISRGTTDDEQVVVSPLGALEDAVATPALVVVGDVVAVREALQSGGRRGAPRSREIPRAVSSTAAATAGRRFRRRSRSFGPATPTAPIASVLRSKIGAATLASPRSASSRSTA